MEHLNRQLKKPKSEQRVMEYLSKMLQVKDSLYKLEKYSKKLKELEEVLKYQNIIIRHA